MATQATSLVSGAPPRPTPRSGPSYWWQTFSAMLRWELASLRMFLPLIVAVQILAGIGFVLGFGLFFPSRVPLTSALYVGAGVPVVNLYLVGLILGPQLVAQQRISQTYDYLRSLPVPRAVGVLPFEYMGAVMRGAVAPSVAGDVGTAYAILLAWACVCAAIAAWAVGRRQ
jgi:hypothetical protein